SCVQGGAGRNRPISRLLASRILLILGAAMPALPTFALMPPRMDRHASALILTAGETDGDAKLASELNELGDQLRAQARRALAEIQCREAIRLAPSFAAPHRGLAALLDGAGKPEEAVAELRKAIELEPGDASAHHALAALLARQGKLDDAAAEYREAIRLNP